MENVALIERATRRSGLIWLDLPGLDCPRAAWHVWHDGAAYVVAGGIEQPLPGLAWIERVTVIVRSKEKGGRLVSWVASVSHVRPGTPEWDAVTPLLAKERLNAPDAESQLERWAGDAYVLRLAPTGELTESPGNMPDDYAAVHPAPSPATTTRAEPFTTGRRRRRRDR